MALIIVVVGVAHQFWANMLDGWSMTNNQYL
jgi:hypothetical protein